MTIDESVVDLSEILKVEGENYIVSWDAAFKKVAGPFIIEKLREGWLPSDIYIAVGHSKTESRIHNEFSKKYFNGLNSEEVRQWLREHPMISSLEEFRVQYISEKRNIKRDVLPLPSLKELLRNYDDSIQAALKVKGYTASDLEELVLQELGKDWIKARKDIVAEYIILQIKTTTKHIQQIYEECGYKDWNRDYFISKKFFGVSSTQLREIVYKYPTQITTLQDFEKYKLRAQGNVLDQKTLDGY